MNTQPTPARIDARKHERFTFSIMINNQRQEFSVTTNGSPGNAKQRVWHESLTQAQRNAGEFHSITLVSREKVEVQPRDLLIVASKVQRRAQRDFDRLIRNIFRQGDALVYDGQPCSVVDHLPNNIMIVRVAKNRAMFNVHVPTAVEANQLSLPA